MSKATFFIILLSVISLILLGSNIYLICLIVHNQQIYIEKQVNQKILDFRDMFIGKVLLTAGEVDFETRLVLETSVRGLNDKDIFNKWQDFASSKTKEDATIKAKDLLDLLIERTSY